MIAVILSCILGAFKGIKDYEMKNAITWNNKYAHDMQFVKDWIPKGIIEKAYKKYHEFFDLKYKERFLFSATALVFLTDKWHLFDTLSFILFLVACFVSVKIDVIVILISYVCYSITFHIFYTLKLKI